VLFTALGGHARRIPPPKLPRRVGAPLQTSEVDGGEAGSVAAGLFAPGARTRSAPPRTPT